MQLSAPTVYFRIMLDADAPDRDKIGTDPKSQQEVQVDHAKCLAEEAGFGSYIYCLSEASSICPHAVHFGARQFCVYPRRKEIVERTHARKDGK